MPQGPFLCQEIRKPSKYGEHQLAYCILYGLLGGGSAVNEHH